MNYVGKLLSNFKGFYNEINSATLTGAIDIIIVEQEDGSFRTSPWHVRFGKLGVLRSREKVVDIEINGQPVDLQMKLGEAGEAFFVQEATDTEEIPAHLATSPIPDTMEMMERGMVELKQQQQQSEIKDESTPSVVTASSNFESTLKLLQPDAISSIDNVLDVAIQTDMSGQEVISRTGKMGLTADQELADVIHCAVEAQDLKQNQSNNVDSDSLRLESGQLTSNDVDESVVCEAGGGSTAQEGSRSPDAMVKKEVDQSEEQIISGEAPKNGKLTKSSSDSEMIGQQTNQCLARSANGKTPSFITISCTNRHVDSADTKKPRRRRRHTQRGTPRSNDKPQKSPHRDIQSYDSTSSVETLFDLELSGDEVMADTSSHQDTATESTYTDTSTSLPHTVSMGLDRSPGPCTSTTPSTKASPSISASMSMPALEWAANQYAANLHPFSDGDITPVGSPLGSRPPTPKSDTEYEKAIKFDATVQTYITGDDLVTIDSVRWRWGELPETNQQIGDSSSANKKTEEQKTSGGLFQFMRKSKKIRHEGIYLDELNLNDLDPEICGLYLYQSPPRRGLSDEDVESGRGASLPQSPITVDTTHGASAGVPSLSLSLCGGLGKPDGALPEEKFMQNLISFDEFCENPNILSDPNLVVKIGEKYYNWQIAGPIILSILAFQRPLPESVIDNLVKQHAPKKPTQRRIGWMWWSRNTDTDKGKEVYSMVEKMESESSSKQKSGKSEKTNKKRRTRSEISSDEDSDGSYKPQARQHSSLGTKPLSVDTQSIDVDTQSMSVGTQMSEPVVNKHQKDYCKTLKLSSEKIAQLSLRPGVNEVCFSVTTQYQGTSRCVAYIYLWKWYDSIIISDIDGTITKSDVLGQVLPMIGKDWSQVGIASLYSQIERNGYKFLYVSARAIGQAKITRDYLKGIRQNALHLPDGPLLLSPSSLISAFHKEVIERRPEDFKISCLKDIKALFPPTRNPFYSGFGNKINDVYAYKAVDIPISRIFTVNHRGELTHQMTCTFKSTYTKMTDTVDQLFPPMREHPTFGQIAANNFPDSDQFSSFTYWRQPIHEGLDAEIEALLGSGGK